MSGIEIPEEQMREVIAAALLKHMDSTMKDGIIGAAIAYLSKSTDRYEAGKSVLIKAFESSVQSVTEKLVVEVLANSKEFRASVKQLTTEALSTWLENADSELRKLAAKGILKAISDTSRY